MMICLYLFELCYVFLNQCPSLWYKRGGYDPSSKRWTQMVVMGGYTRFEIAYTRVSVTIGKTWSSLQTLTYFMKLGYKSIIAWKLIKRVISMYLWYFNEFDIYAILWYSILYEIGVSKMCQKGGGVGTFQNRLWPIVYTIYIQGGVKWYISKTSMTYSVYYIYTGGSKSPILSKTGEHTSNSFCYCVFGRILTHVGGRPLC